jgi:hypothetical protein
MNRGDVAHCRCRACIANPINTNPRTSRVRVSSCCTIRGRLERGQDIFPDEREADGNKRHIHAEHGSKTESFCSRISRLSMLTEHRALSEEIQLRYQDESLHYGVVRLPADDDVDSPKGRCLRRQEHRPLGYAVLILNIQDAEQSQAHILTKTVFCSIVITWLMTKAKSA